MEARLFPEGTIPEHSTPAWYLSRDRAPHIDQDLHRGRIEAAADLVLKTLTELTISAKEAASALPYVVDLGAGDGGLLSLLDRAGVKGWGYDLQPTNIAGAKERGVDVRLGDAVDGEIEWAPIVIATEMIEHLVSPDQFVQRIYEHADIVIASSPWTETAESHYEYHLWAFDHAGYADLFERNGFEVVDHLTVGMFQVIRARKIA